VINFDLIVIGAGPAGYEAALQAGKFGKKVLLIEKEELGGVCTNKGCIPTKSLLNSAKHFFIANNSEKFGVKAENVTFDLLSANKWKNSTIETLRSGIKLMLEKQNIKILKGEALILDKNMVKVGDIIYKTENLILATGSRPMIINIEGVDGPNVMTSNEILNLEIIPEEITIIGGGVIGIEFASFFSMLQVKVTVIEMMEEILPMMDKDLAKLMRREMKGVTFHLGCRVTSIGKESITFIDSKNREKTEKCSTILLSSGRQPNTEGLEVLKLEMFKRWVKVDDSLKTSIDNVYAIGDLNGKSQLAHSASKMAEIAIDNIFGSGTKKMNWNSIPWAVYSLPEASGCGLTEEEAIKEKIKVKCGVTFMRSNGRFLAENDKRSTGKVKIVVNAETDEILGIHMIGPYSSEMIWPAGTLIENKITYKQVASSVFAHPSISETIKEACLAIEE